MAYREFAHLHIHNEFSFLDGVGPAKEWAERGKALNITSMALTNHGNIDGVIRWQKAMKEAGINGIIGVEAYIVPNLTYKPPKGERDRRFHITLLVKSGEGFRNLMKLMTKANSEGLYKGAWGKEFPRIDSDALLEHSEGLVVLSGCSSTFIGMENNRLKDIVEAMPVYLEVMPLEFEPQKTLNLQLLGLSRSTGLKLVATNDCHYVRKGDDTLQEVLLALQTKTKWNDPKRWRFDIDSLYLKSWDEMFLSFLKQGILDKHTIHSALENSLEVGELCQFYQDQIPVVLPAMDVPGMEGKPPEDQLFQLSLDGLNAKAEKHQYIAKEREKYDERLAEELSQIISLGFSRYFLIVWELVHWCEQNDIMVGPGRGSVGGSLVAYVLGITKVDPFPYGLVFTRFISPARIDLPDIDMDFEDRKRPLIYQHLQELYGEHNVTALSNFGRLHGRGALRDIGRTFELPPGDVDKAAKAIVVRSGGDMRESFTIEDSFLSFEDCKKFYEKYPNESKIAMKLEGQIKAAGKHAAAMCVLSEPVPSGSNCSYVCRKGELLACWDKEDAEHMGMMKLDVLGLNQLTILAEARRLVKSRYGAEIDYEKIPLDDEKCLKEFSSGNNIGCFQLNSLGMMRICGRIGMDSFKEIVAVNALHRPGCLRSGMVEEYTARKRGEKSIEKIHEFFDRICEDTYGIILYQEQIMQMMYQLAGLPWKTADTVRKVISKSKGEEQFLSHKQAFIDGCKEHNTVDPETAETLFDQVKFFGSYGFNKSHAVEYALMAYWDMWLKVYYPNEFIECLLSYDTNDDRKNDYINEAKRLGLSIALPQINISRASVWVSDGEGRLTIPFSEIKGIGEKAALKIEEERERGGPFADEKDLERRIERRVVNKRVREKLREVRAFDSHDDDIPDSELERLSEFFSFNLSNDPMFRYRRCYERLMERVNIEPINSIDWNNRDDTLRYYFGNMAVLRFGYKDKVRSKSSEMGGVYGNLVDESDYAMLVFSADLYKSRKEEIEHCEGKWLLAEANHPWNSTSIRAKQIWFGDDLLAGKLEGLNPRLDTGPAAPDLFEWIGENMVKCEACELRGECTAVVPPNLGVMGVSVIAEAPGPKEDKLGEGLVGGSGDLTWGVMKEYGLRRELFHISNIVKCYPSITRNPKTKHIKACSHWLESELRAVRPYLVMAFGNSAREFFTGDGSGITSVNGETEWNDDYQCWICWGIHPSSVLRGAFPKSDLELAIKNFAEKVAWLS